MYTPNLCGTAITFSVGACILIVFYLLFLGQVSSDLLHVWFLVCCVFNSAVDRFRDNCPVVLFPSLCRGIKLAST